MASIGVCVAVNQIIGGTEGGKLLNRLTARQTDISNASKNNLTAA
jgi:hypothetical protein